ncbi:AfsR/SARP family transcriptional regulator [Streptomyces hainanensis]|nr:BTAD domain-containing putative transcriptional regulator [Streptomyces hainanensis]
MPPADVGFLLLGPLEAHVGGRAVALTGRQRQLLAILLLESNRVVSVDRLADGLWGGDQPASPAARIRALVAEVRRAAGHPGLILTRSPGYLLPTRQGQTDADDFDQLVRRAAEASGGGDLDAAAELYGAALALWRGDPLVDVPNARAHEVAGLVERRWSALAEQVDVLLARGDHERVAAELPAAIAEDPLRERFRAQLMRALHQDGRQSAALRVYHDYRERLAEELGAEPSRELQRLLAYVQVSDPDVRRRPGPQASAPRHLPRDIGRLVGRGEESAWLDELSGGGLGVLVGPAGVGKTALAVHWAHRAAPLFPDGQLFVDMRGFAPGPAMSPGEVLVRLLRALGVAAPSVPSDLDEQIALYRSLLAGRRVLILLDNAAEAAHVRPLIPGEPGCLLLISSRHQLGGLVALDGARRHTVEPLNRAAAVELIAQRAGGGQLETERGALAELAAMVGDLPLALCVAGAQLSERPERGVAEYVADLARHDLLARLRLHDDERTFVRAALDLSYLALPPEARRVYRLLGLVPGPDVSVAAAAALAGVALPEAEKALDAAAQVHLATRTRDGHFGLHDLLREFAARLSGEAEEPAAREAAFRGLLDHYLFTMAAANQVMGPYPQFVPDRSTARQPVSASFPDPASATTWVEGEWDNVAAAIARAAAHGPHDMAWQLVAGAQSFLIYRPAAESMRVAELGVAAARRAGDAFGLAAAQAVLEVMHRRTGHMRNAERHSRRAALLARRAGWPVGEARALVGSGSAQSALGQPRRAVRHYQRALAIYSGTDDRAGAVIGMSYLAAVQRKLGRLDEAERVLRSQLAVVAGLEAGAVETQALATMALVWQDRGQLDQALPLLDRARDAARATPRLHGARLAEAIVDGVSGRLDTERGQYRDAVDHLTRAVDGARRAELPGAQADFLNWKATALLRLGETESAQARLADALEILRGRDNSVGNLESLLGFAEVAHRRGDHDDALDRASRALTEARRTWPLFSGQAHHLLATVLLDRGDLDGCLGHCERGLVVCRRTGQHLMRGRLLLVRGRARRRQGDERGARAAWHAARRVLAEMPVPERAEVAALLG